MRGRSFAIIVASLLLTTGLATVCVAPVVATSADAGPAATATPTEGAEPTAANASETPEISSLYPNPRADGDAGEYVVVDVPEPTNASGWTIVDDAGTVARLPNRTLSGRTILSPEPDAVDGPNASATHALDGRLRLANGGDVVRLRRPDGTVVSESSYREAPEGERYRRIDGEWRWTAPGATALEPIETTPDGATAFVLPDAPSVVENELRTAEERLYLGGYTLTSERVVDALLDAERRGVDVRVLLEGSPVGGTSSRQADALDRLSANDVSVTVLAGDRDPFGVHHAKYAVVDDRSLVLTENYKPAGTGGHSSRGWGVVVDGRQTADGLARIFRADRTGPGTVNWNRHRSSIEPVPGGSSTGAYPEHFSPAEVTVDRARLLVAPDNARPEVEALLRSANHSIRIQQMEIDGADDPLLQASIDAARNGTEVEILLSSASYVEQENRAVVREIDRIAAREELPISASLVDPRGRFSKVHAKVAIVDDRHVVLGSLNWNPAAYEENREVVVVLSGEEVAEYYAAVFESDARDAPRWPIPRGVVAAVCVLWLAIASLAIARIRWATT